jgi:hypothetical protein
VQPQRPYVPHHTPRKPQPAIRSSDFILARPFVGGTAAAGNLQPELPAERHEASSLPPIQSFLASSDALPFAKTTAEESYENAALETDDELPPVEHFLDPLPSVGEFMASAAGGAASGEPDEDPFGGAPAAGANPTGWAEIDWQQYDWRSAAALGESSDPNASTAWATTDWDAGPARPKEARPSAAQAFAAALDQIAKRIRDGELALPGSGGASDPAALASTLAALFGIKP